MTGVASVLRQNRTLTQAMLNMAQPQLAKSGSYSFGYCPFHSGSTGFDLLLNKDRTGYRCTICGAYGRVEHEPPPTLPPADIELMVHLYDYSVHEPQQGHEPGPVHAWFERRREYRQRSVHRAFLISDWSDERAARISQHADRSSGDPMEMVWFARNEGCLHAYRRRPSMPILTQGLYGILRFSPEDVREAVHLARSLRLHKAQRVVAPRGTTP